MPNTPNNRAGEIPALLVLRLPNGLLMATHLNRSDANTLAMLNRWYARFIHALMLLQQGNLEAIAGRGVIALHRDLDEPRYKHQPQFFRGGRLLLQYAHGQKLERLYFFANVPDMGWCERSVIR